MDFRRILDYLLAVHLLHRLERVVSAVITVSLTIKTVNIQPIDYVALNTLEKEKFTYRIFIYFSWVIYLHHKSRYKTNLKRAFFARLFRAI